jgi:endonuclease/exonuclease/phosphatase family metal-dependent hydrolase
MNGGAFVTATSSGNPRKRFVVTGCTAVETSEDGLIITFMRIVSWNIAHRDSAWQAVLAMNADVALLQEATKPPPELVESFRVDDEPWETGGDGHRPWRTAVVKLSKDARVDWLPSRPLETATSNDMRVSRRGTLAVASIAYQAIEPFYVVSMYGVWERPLHSTESGWIYADASVHRLISDQSAIIGSQNGHRIIAAGDLNILNGYGEFGSPFWSERYASVFQRMQVLGLLFVGPQAPDGVQADPWPEELPKGSGNVPTYHTTRQTPATATRQLDFVFASQSLVNKVHARALNKPEDWGPSDHCQIAIEVHA